MKIIEHVVEQGSPAWLELRKGVVTASCFGRLFGTARDKNAYLKQLRDGVKSFSSHATNWGKANEAEARAWCRILGWQYCISTGLEMYEAGFFTRSDWPGVGCSPDGVVRVPNLPGTLSVDGSVEWREGDIVGGVEIKCPYDPNVHMRYLKYGMPDLYLWQVAGCMWITGAQWWDFVSYNPRLRKYEDRLFYQRLYRNDEMMKTLERALDEFVHVYKSDSWFADVTAKAALMIGDLSQFIK